MSVTITTAGLIAVQPEWTTAPAAVIAHAVAVANAAPFDTLYTDTTQETHRRYLEAGAILYLSPYGRDLNQPGQAAVNPYRLEAQRLDALAGGAYRCPGWSLPAGVV